MARVAAFVDDLFFAAKVQETLRAAGHEVELVVARRAEGPEPHVHDQSVDQPGDDAVRRQQRQFGAAPGGR